MSDALAAWLRWHNHKNKWDTKHLCWRIFTGVSQVIVWAGCIDYHYSVTVFFVCVLGESHGPEAPAASLLREGPLLSLPLWPQCPAAGTRWLGKINSRLLFFLTCCHFYILGISGYLRRFVGSFLPAAHVGPHHIWSIALHSQSQTAEGAVDLCVQAHPCWTRLWQSVHWWDFKTILLTWCALCFKSHFKTRWILWYNKL